MNLDRDASTTDDYFVTAIQIFDYCGADSSGTIQVDELMDKFAPFVKTNNTEFSVLKSLLDPEQTNPKINVMMLAKALSQYSENQKTKVDLDESFNLKGGPMPQDSDSGISTDGFQLLEDLQSELREKSHLAQQLRSQLDYSDRQHEEALVTLTAERDSLRAHLNMLREENLTLSHVRHDYEETCERLCGSEQALGEVRRELDTLRKRNRALEDEVAMLDNRKLTLQELLNKSKDECHRINEMYASRQSALLEENETLKTERADLAARLQDQEEFMQQIIKEKVLLEMELKDLLNKSNQTQLRLDRSIDVSYTEDQMLTTLDTLNADSRFTPENRLLDEESFVNALKEDQGRASHMSLFDEIRLSFCNMSKLSIDNDSQCNKCTDHFDNSFINIGMQTDESFHDDKPLNCCQCGNMKLDINLKCTEIQTEPFLLGQSKLDLFNIETQPEELNISFDNNNCGDCAKCYQCAKLNEYTTKLESDLLHSNSNVKDLQLELDKCEENLIALQNYLGEENDRNSLLQTIVNSLQAKIGLLEAACVDQKDRLDKLTCETCFAECQTECDQLSVSTQIDVPCVDCEKRRAVVPHKSIRRYLWEPIKCLFQVFAVVCFVCAVSVLYGVTRRWHARCDDTAPVPWKWLDAQELMDLLLRIEYVADVPM